MARTVQQGSWRGVPFEVVSVTTTRGRRVDVTEYPYRDDPDADDLGRARRNHSVVGFLRGEGWEDACDRLIAAIEQPGAGAFVHPWRGSLNCRLLSSSETHSSDDLEGYEFSAELVEVSPTEQDRRTPIATRTASTGVDVEADAVQASALGDWSAGFAFGDVPEALRQDAFATLPYVAVLERSSFAWWRLDDDARDALTDYAVAGFGAAFYDADEPLALPDSWSALVEVVGDVSFVRGILGARVPTSQVERVETTPGRIATNAHARLVDAYCYGTLAAELARLVVELEYDTATAAEAARGVALDALDAELEVEAHGDETYRALSALRAAVVGSFDRLLETLPAVVEAFEPMPEPALAIAWRLYGDADRADEVVDLNDCVHPAFVPETGTTIRVLEW